MHGLPLNHQLTQRGATFLGAATTTESYHFYALAGDPPARPGLVIGAPGSGASIAVELWSLPFEKAGSFLDAITALLVSTQSICPMRDR
jgi:allophanate hydrolase